MLTKGFRSRYLRDEHFDEHSAEMGASDENDYETKADQFLGGPLEPGVLEGSRPLDGATIRWNFTTQEFGILSADGYIQTFFKPDPTWHGKPTNRAYFEWECRRRR